MRIGRDDIKILSGKNGFNEWNRSKLIQSIGLSSNGCVCPACMSHEEDDIAHGDTIEAEDLHDGEIAVRSRCMKCGASWISVFAVGEDGGRQWQKWCLLKKA